ncbi:hypothetical protein TeGR_g4405, partial [Tetraparma gracilis]
MEDMTETIGALGRSYAEKANLEAELDLLEDELEATVEELDAGVYLQPSALPETPTPHRRD